MTRTCKHCNETFPKTSEYFYKNTKYLHSWCKTCFRKYIKQKRYGVSLDFYEEKFEEQEGKCAVCGITQCKTGRSFSIDHNHKTGDVRGLLCAQCNMALGSAREDIKILKKLIKYLEKHKR